MKIQLFSERCTGSNFIENFIRHNFEGVEFTEEFGFKHWMPAKPLEHRENVLYLIITRNAFDWLRSLHQQPWHVAPTLKDLDFSTFIRREWHCIWDESAYIYNGDPLYNSEMESERHPITGERFRNVIEMRTWKHRVWLKALQVSPNSLVISYEAFTSNPGQFFDLLKEKFNLTPKGAMEVPAGYKGNLSWKRRLVLKLSFGLIGGYKPKKYQPLSQEDRQFILNELEPDLESQLGYAVEVPASTGHELQTKLA